MSLRIEIQSAELRRHAQSLAKLAATLEQAEDFPNDTAREFCGVIRSSAELIHQRINSAPADRLPHIHFVLGVLGEDLRYAERSRVEHTPWSLVQALEGFLQTTVGPEYRFIIRPQWSYNYAIIGDRLAYYRSLFQSLPGWISLDEWHAAIADAASYRIYSISFPRVERMNVLTHANWGHEVGHILISEWMADHFDALWQSGAHGIETAIRDYLESNSGAPKLLVDQFVATFMNDTLSLTRKSLKELISDAIGAHLLGPAALASLCEFSCRFDLDANPVECGGYPPWRFRLRKLSQILLPTLQSASTTGWHPALSHFVKWLSGWRQITDLDADRAAIDSDIRSRKAYELIEVNYESIRKQVLARLRPGLQAPYALEERHEQLGELIARIESGVPPNETGIWPATQPAGMADIWNAGWSCKIQRFAEGSGPEFDEYLEMLFQLTLKAIESSYVHTTFSPLINR